MQVKVRMQVTSKAQQRYWSKNEDGSYPMQTTINMSVVHTSDKDNPNYPYAQLSGGTSFPLVTINDAAAEMFEIGKDYDVIITPAQ